MHKDFTRLADKDYFHHRGRDNLESFKETMARIDKKASFYECRFIANP